MDIKNRQIIKQKESFIQSLDLEKLKPFLENSQIFTNAMLKDIYSSKTEYNLCSELPTRGPKAFSQFLDVLKKAGYNTNGFDLAPIDPNQTNGFEPEKKLFWYPIESNPVGYCLIINNEKFKYLEEREGSDVDVKQLRILFEEIGYKVKEKRNLKGEEMEQCLLSFSQSKFLEDTDCCFVVILSHGGTLVGTDIDVIYGTDSFPVKKRDIYDMFNNDNCANLRMKPKVFLFQACRGQDEDSGVFLRESTDSVKMKKIPIMNDILVYHSTLPHHKAYRDHFEGSWFIQDIVSVLQKNYLYQDFETMLRTVSRKIQNRLSLKGGNKQVIHKEDRGFRAYLHICSNNNFKGCVLEDRNYKIETV